MEYVELARAESPRGELVLRQRKDPDAAAITPVVLELRVNGVFVMDSVETSSEKGMASTALEQVEHPGQVAIGGLGLGFTMHEVLADQRVERLVVVEVEEELVRWMRDGTVPHGPSYLADERLTLVTADIRIAMAEAAPATYDLILLDVDNGPGSLVYEQNAGIYQQEFLLQARQALRRGGALAIWSAAASEDLAGEMNQAFGNVVAVRYEVALQSREEQYWLYLAERN